MLIFGKQDDGYFSGEAPFRIGMILHIFEISQKERQVLLVSTLEVSM